MSNAPYLLGGAREGYKLGDGVLIDSILFDGLIDTFENEHMGITGERLAEEYEISRKEQDTFALSSHKKYFEALKKGIFDNEMVKISDLENDEHPREDTTIEKLGTLKPAFSKDGTVTAGNSSGINDGAAMLVVCSEKYALKKELEVMAVIKNSTSVGCDWRYMGLGPVYAVKKLLNENDLKIEEFDIIELNEAFASQTISCMRELKIDLNMINPDGGAIALGHPIGSSGARLIVHLASGIKSGRAKKAIAALCVGGGMGSSVIIESY
jgi:acetyl-CoA C-acetyltransferase